VIIVAHVQGSVIWCGESVVMVTSASFWFAFIMFVKSVRLFACKLI